MSEVNPMSRSPDDLPGAQESSLEQYYLSLTMSSGEKTSLDSILPVTLGSDPEISTIPLAGDETVSALHARIYWDENWEAICIEDLDSLSGIRINGLPTRKNILQNGVEISLGNTTFAYHDVGYLGPQADQKSGETTR